MSEQLHNTASQGTTISNTISQLDIYGFALIIIAAALIIIAYSLTKLSRKINSMSKASAVPINKRERVQSSHNGMQPDSNEVQAAIALALHFHENELHDSQNTVLTINRVTKFYSPWSSKIYGLSKNPR